MVSTRVIAGHILAVYDEMVWNYAKYSQKNVHNFHKQTTAW